MADIKQHPVLIRDLISLHKQTIHSAHKNEMNSNAICADCFVDTLKPKSADNATYQTHLPTQTKR